MTKTTTKKGTKTRTSAYDVAEHLRPPEEMAAYLDAWFEAAPDDAAGIARALGDIARAKGMTQVAKDAGLSRESATSAGRSRCCDWPTWSSLRSRVDANSVSKERHRPDFYTLAFGRVGQRSRVFECGMAHEAGTAVGFGVVGFEQQRLAGLHLREI